MALGPAPGAGRWPRRGRGLNQPRLAAPGGGGVTGPGVGTPLPAGVALTATPPERHRRQAQFTCASVKLALYDEIYRASAPATAACAVSDFSVLTVVLCNKVSLYPCLLWESNIVIAKEKKASLNSQDDYNGKELSSSSPMFLPR